jgi:magnesium transporter
MVSSTRSDTITNKDLTWINIENPTRESMREILRYGYHFHELNIADCLSKIQIPKIDRYRDYIFVILHFPTATNTTSSPHHFHSPPQRDSTIAVITSSNTRKRKHSHASSSTSSLHLSQLSIFAGKNFLVTVHQGDLQPLNELFHECEEGDSSKRDEIMGKTSGYLLHKIIDVLVDDLFHLLMKIVGNLQDIEEAVFDDKVEVVREISLLRRDITALRRIVFPLSRIVSEISSRDIQKISEEEDLTEYYNDVEDHINKVLEVLESSRETIEIYKDTDFMLNTEKANQILGILTIVFTLSIPVAIIGTFYGMNINLSGEIETGPWTFLGTYTTLIIVLTISVASALVMYWYFRKVGWITSPIRRKT